MERIKVDMSADMAKLLEEDKKTLEELKKVPIVQQFIQKNGVSDAILLESLQMLQQMVDDDQRCNGCVGLPYCRHQITGKKYVLEYGDGYLIEAYQDCHYASEKHKRESHRENFRYSDMSDDDYCIDLCTIQLKKESNEYLSAYLAVDSSIDKDKGVYLYGQTGVGKSYLMKGMCNEYAKKGFRVCYCHVPTLIESIISSNYDTDLIQDRMYQFRKCDVLVLDDIGAENVRPWEREKLMTIVDYRLENHKKTYFTSNYSMKELFRRYSNLENGEGSVPAERLLDRIRPLVEEVLLKGKSRR